MTDRREALERAGRVRVRRRRVTPVAVSAAVAAGGIGALAWVAPRTGTPATHGTPSAHQSALLEGLKNDEAAMVRLHEELSEAQSQVTALAAAPVPGASSVPASPPAPLPSLSLPVLSPPPPVHATTGASGAIVP